MLAAKKQKPIKMCREINNYNESGGLIYIM
jgi:hypothetical protein